VTIPYGWKVAAPSTDMWADDPKSQEWSKSACRLRTSLLLASLASSIGDTPACTSVQPVAKASEFLIQAA